jgi:hypothetical protein
VVDLADDVLALVGEQVLVDVRVQPGGDHVGRWS